MRYFYVMLFAAAMVCSLFASGAFVFWMYLISVGKPAMGALVFAGVSGILGAGLLLAWAAFLNKEASG